MSEYIIIVLLLSLKYILLPRLHVKEMKKLFSLKSSASKGGQNSAGPPFMKDDRPYMEIPRETGTSDIIDASSQRSWHVFPVSVRKKAESCQTTSYGPGLRRSHSSSSSAAAAWSGRHKNGNLFELSKQSRSQSSVDGGPDQSFDFPPSDYPCPTTSDNQTERHDMGLIKIDAGEVMNVNRDCSCLSHSSSPRNSSSTSVISHLESSDRKSDSNKVLDLYIDGEQEKQQEMRSRYNNDCHLRNPNKRNSSAVNGKGRSNSFFPTTKMGSYPQANCLRYESRQRSPRRLAKDVVERLSRSQEFPIGTLCDKPLDRHKASPVVGGSKRTSPSKSFSISRGREAVCAFGSQKKNSFPDKEYRSMNLQQEEEVDSQLHRKLREVNNKAMHLSKELDQEFFSQYYECTVSTLCQKIRKLTEEQRDLLLKFSTQLQCRIIERMSAKEAILLVKGELNSKVVRLEKEKNEVESQLQKELDRRSDNWNSELKEYQLEENRLRDRVRELAEQNISLQRELSSFYYKEKDFDNKVSLLEVQLSDVTSKFVKAKSDDLGLEETLSRMQEKLGAVEEMLACTRRNLNEKENESKELAKTVARLQRTCGEQERTIDGLRKGVTDLDPEKSQQPTTGHDLEKYTINRLQMEQLRLTGIEQVLRREIETCRRENESLRRENISLLERLQDTNKVSGGHSSIKLEQELSSRMDLLQGSGLSLLDESTQICAELLELMKNRTDYGAHETESKEKFMEMYSVMDWELKVQGHKHGMEQLKRSLQKTTSVLKEKSELNASNSAHGLFSEVDVKSELKAESLMTSILKEKLYSKEQENEQLHVDLATTLRHHDAIKSEMQNAFDTISCINHKMKDLELQMMKKVSIQNQLENDLQACGEELAMTRGFVTKVSKERDLLWEEVKQYSEKNMVSNYEINTLKKKIEGLEEDALIKEGQITILKDSLNSRRYDNLLFDNENGNETRDIFNLHLNN